MTQLIEDVLWNDAADPTIYFSNSKRSHHCWGVRLTLVQWERASMISLEPLKDREDPKPAIGLGIVIPVSKIPELRAALRIMEDALAQQLRQAANAGDETAAKALHDRLDETA